jgi:DNA-binding beta-propeller fold protein YncE
MREDFVTRLKLQLRDAAEREARGGSLAHTLRDTRWRLSSPALAAGLAVILGVIAVAAGALLLRDEPQPATPRVVATLHLTGNPEGMLSAFGSLWIADPVAGDVVRVDPQTRRVVARIHVGSTLGIAIEPVGNELWVVSDQPAVVERIDPASNTISGRLRLRTPDGRTFQAFQVLPSPRGVWLAGSEGTLRVDPSTGDGLALVAAPTADSDPSGVAIGDQDLWSLRTDGRIERFDAATGRPLGDFSPGLRAPQFIAGFGRDLLALAPGAIARLDGTTGRVIWQRALGEHVDAFDAAEGLIWVHSTAAREPDQLTALAAGSGKTVTSTALETFGSTGLAVTGQEIWIDTTGGKTIVVRR